VLIYEGLVLIFLKGFCNGCPYPIIKLSHWWYVRIGLVRILVLFKNIKIMNTYSRDGLSLYCLGRASFLRWPSHTQTIYSPSGGGHKVLQNRNIYSYSTKWPWVTKNIYSNAILIWYSLFPTESWRIPMMVILFHYQGINNDGYDNTNHDLILR
jgi:hypothetical protein